HDSGGLPGTCRNRHPHGRQSGGQRTKPAGTKNPACAGFSVIGGFQRYLLKPEDGAQKRTRTSTELPPLAPEASASTNSATWAGGRVWCSAAAALSTAVTPTRRPRRTRTIAG